MTWSLTQLWAEGTGATRSQWDAGLGGTRPGQGRGPGIPRLTVHTMDRLGRTRAKLKDLNKRAANKIIFREKKRGMQLPIYRDGIVMPKL